MAVQKVAGDAGAKEDPSHIPPFTMPALTATLALLPFAFASEIFILWPLVWAAATATVVSVVLRRGSAISRRLGLWARPVGAVLVATVLMGTGGIAYTYGAYGNLTATATAEADPLDLTDGANHTVTFVLKNLGPTTVRTAWLDLDLDLQGVSGEAVLAMRCPTGLPSHSRDRDLRELAPGGTIRLEVRLLLEGTNLTAGCFQWQVFAGQTYSLHGAVVGRPGGGTLPVWVGRVESNQVPVIT